MLERKEAMFRASLAASVEPVAGIHALLDWAEAADAGCAVVTNAPRDNAVAMLAAASLAHRLPTAGDRRRVRARRSPTPSPIKPRCARWASRPSRAVAFEDSRSGIRAARDAGAHVFGMTTGLAPDALLQPPARTPRSPTSPIPRLWAHLSELKARVA